MTVVAGAQRGQGVGEASDENICHCVETADRKQERPRKGCFQVSHEVLAVQDLLFFIFLGRGMFSPSPCHAWREFSERCFRCMDRKVQGGGGSSVLVSLRFPRFFFLPTVRGLDRRVCSNRVDTRDGYLTPRKSMPLRRQGDVTSVTSTSPSKHRRHGIILCTRKYKYDF